MSIEKTTLPHPDDTIVAVASAQGAGARAIVRIGGPDARRVIDRVFQPSVPAKRARNQVSGSLALSGVHSPLPATLYFFPGPRSYTGQDLAELHTLGSPPLVERLVVDLLGAGARPAQPGEFTLRAFLAGKKDLPQAEAVNAVVAAGTDADLKLALEQLAGGVTSPLLAIRHELLDLLADLEAGLDFADEDIEFVGKSETLARLGAALDRITALARQLDDRSFSGRPVRVALVGLPNAGKSSLFNTLAGGEAIVSPVPGTTRDYLTQRLELGGVSAELIDTAGWQESANTIEEQAQRLGRDAIAQADIILWCDDRGEFVNADAARLATIGAEVLRVRTKADLSGQEPPNSTSIATSIMRPDGTIELRAVLTQRIAALVRPALAPSQSRCRHHVAACSDHIRGAYDHVTVGDPPELAAAALRAAIDQLGELTGAVYTNDLLDRIFARFCIGK